MPPTSRRSFLGAAISAVPLLTGATYAQPPAKAAFVRAGDDREGVHKTLGISTIDFKVTSADSGGAMLVIENTNRAKGGPAKHLHTTQDELFYCIEGEYRIEIGGVRYDLKAGDSILAPRRVPHVWAFVGNTMGRLLITFTPPGAMEAFFREVSKGNAMPIQDPELWRAHGMELLGPPLPV
ncbi:cupin domain-containing protein [Gemmatimonas groenlandica]|uniref:Cupin domain-containing protein n=1 Tax=Gemmatimonas groenlandica TaxID=2732249 RepID=A0A6M4ISE1_9BACT|nr:cupin domain-containing protein [Gemmatimonas groenlandica]QJR37663.1 cupin domain-containing protein [Gemmatimonas groenlandica]